ncbi:MAG: hypothetical protein ACRENP_25190 [Longimicrobiales bacterium]
MTERRYREDEVREIFGLATRRSTDPPPLSRTDGLTLAEIQGIGREVGLEPGDVARAAATLAARGMTLPRRTSLGMPIGVGRIVPLARALTDAEWEQLVAELRSTFGARGKVTTQGSLREWFNGNLHACVEPAEGGYRLRLGTLKSDARGLNALGLMGIAAATITYATLAVSGGLAESVFLPTMLGTGGVVAFVANRLRLPRWARQREQQMEYIAGRVGSIVNTKPGNVQE